MQEQILEKSDLKRKEKLSFSQLRLTLVNSVKLLVEIWHPTSPPDSTAELGIFEAEAGAAASLWQCCIRVSHHILLTSLPLCSSTSTPWLPPSSRRCFRQIPLPVQPFRSCSMTSFSLLAISLPASPSPASPFRPGFQLLPVAWTPTAGSLSLFSIKVNRGLGRPQESLGLRCVNGWSP